MSGVTPCVTCSSQATEELYWRVGVARSSLSSTYSPLRSIPPPHFNTPLIPPRCMAPSPVSPQTVHKTTTTTTTTTASCAKYQYVLTPDGARIVPVPDAPSKDEESAADYNPGGLLPVKLGDRFKNGRYKVVRKLG